MNVFDGNIGLGRFAAGTATHFATAGELLSYMDRLGIGEALTYSVVARECGPEPANEWLVRETAGLIQFAEYDLTAAMTPMLPAAAIALLTIVGFDGSEFVSQRGQRDPLSAIGCRTAELDSYRTGEGGF